MTKQALGEVLELLNKARGVFDLPPLAAVPCGTPRSGHCCPIAEALEGLTSWVGARDVELWSGAEDLAAAWGTDYCKEGGEDEGDDGDLQDTVALPDVLYAFRCDFDNGEYPELEIQ